MGNRRCHAAIEEENNQNASEYKTEWIHLISEFVCRLKTRRVARVAQSRCFQITFFRVVFFFSVFYVCTFIFLMFSVSEEVIKKNCNQGPMIQL